MMIMKFYYFVWILALLSCIACNSQPSTAQKSDHTKVKVTADEKVADVLPTLSSDTVFTLPFENNPIKISIYYPQKGTFKGNIVALPGWNFPATDWCDSTSLCSMADSLGYVIILPEMGKSIYCKTLYPETRKDWRKFPTRSWISEKLIPKLQTDFGILLGEQPNYVMGLSTGARGAALLALDHPELFKACALLSGDYDQTQYPKDNLYRGYYGAQNLFPDRWKNEDNLFTAINRFKVPAYIGHGKNDKIVPIKHSEELSKRLNELNKEVLFRVDENAQHNYVFWNSEVKSVLTFFQEH